MNLIEHYEKVVSDTTQKEMNYRTRNTYSALGKAINAIQYGGEFRAGIADIAEDKVSLNISLANNPSEQAFDRVTIETSDIENILEKEGAYRAPHEIALHIVGKFAEKQASKTNCGLARKLML